MIPAFIGRHPLGAELPLCLKCTLAGAADTPSTHPTVEVRSETTWVYFGRVPADDQGVAAGVFRGPLMLDERYSPGRYTLYFRWADSGGGSRVEAHQFQVIAGGSADGSLIAMHPVDRPHANYLLYATDAGKLVRGRNPR